MPVEHLVVDRDDPPRRVRMCRRRRTPSGRDRGGEVERPRGGRPPVDQQLVVVAVVVEDPDPADVAAVAVVEVEPAEAQTVLAASSWAIRRTGRRADPHKRVFGVLQLINALDRQGAVRAFSPDEQALVQEMAAQTARLPGLATD